MRSRGAEFPEAGAGLNYSWSAAVATNGIEYRDRNSAIARTNGGTYKNSVPPSGAILIQYIGAVHRESTRKGVTR
jgi:hypothetical protein